MRPLKLTMTAFGPYKRTETIDFNELDQYNLFVISGNTGSGKTTIFDGICFALYGSASGTDREDNRMLRSDFAADDTHTAIELEFEINDRHYRILRQPGHVKKGNKSKTGERYEFYEKMDGREVPCVDRQIVSEIDKKVEEIIGLTQDQFKQIVMLPQGEFRKLLTSQTENKEAILRRLFKTESYNQINLLLRDRKNRVDQTFKQAQQMLDHYIQSIYTALPERKESELFNLLSDEFYNINQIASCLDAEIAYYTEQISIDEQKYQDAYQKHDRKQTELHQAKALNDQFADLDKKRNDLEELKKQVPAYTEKEKHLEDAEQASHLEIYEKQTADWKQDEKIKTEFLHQAKSTDEDAKRKLEQAEYVYRQEEHKKSEREEAGRQLERLKGYLPTVKELDQRKNDLETLAQKGKKAAEDLQNVKKDLQKKTEETEAYDKKITEIDQAVTQLPEKQQARTNMQEQYKAVNAYLNLQTKYSSLKQDVERKETSFLTVQKAYREKEHIWLNNQAVILADHLHDGEACPVCGSNEHPHKANNQGEVISRSELTSLKKELDNKEKLYREAAAEVKSKAKELTEKEQELVDNGIKKGDAASLKEHLLQKGTKLKREVEFLEKQREELKQYKADHKKAKEEQKRLETKKEQLDKTYQDLQSDYRAASEVYKEKLRTIPEDVQTVAALEKQIESIELHKTKLEKAWDDAQQQLNQAKELSTKAGADLKHAQKQLNETKEKRTKAEQQFQQALSEAKFETEEAYHTAKMPAAERQKWKDTIRRFNENLSAKKQQVNDLSEILKHKERVNLSRLQEELEMLKQAYEQAYKALNQSKDYKHQASNIRGNLMQAHEQVADREKELAAITDLYDVLRGQNNQKISFERYLQIEYLERIIEAANGRLKRLSNGQFYLMRSERQESHGRQSGLALDVYDAYTGQTRDVKTLSGGEKFNASLCLALGMSDVIQSFQGNISMDTMFIDEGFGTLDEESLNKAIDTLIDLQQSGRMIGVISHVQDLKTMFPARLDVIKTKEGHSRTQFQVK
ncbi:exonuclease SbcC [Lentibacillus halodurans]|uniref:Nuclease SbcCD subunit C n=1 Tax=Lentibacillus halodurans TaxID=237679 RepID=A0A1I0W4M5_9BACI|nr:SMC family ATPase [Lentibacillus halodurans]SFA83521.1 exonuclease SbcC [Lentibacillus halodurans]